MVVKLIQKKPALKKKRKVKRGITTKAQTKKGKAGNVSQVVNVYVSKANRRRATAPKQFTQAIQPQMYNAGQDNMILGLTQQNKTLMDILNKQRTTDTTPNSDITSLDDLIRVKKLDVDEKSETPKRDDDVNYGGVASVNPKYSLDTTSSQNISNMLSSIAEGMDEIPQGQEIKNRIIAIGDQVRPLPDELTGVRERVAGLNELDELGKLEVEYGDLLKELQNQSITDNTIKMSKYINKTKPNTLPKKVSTLKKLVSQMKNDLLRSTEKR